MEKYAEWADDYQENQITIIYDTMWNGTKTMAEHIAGGITAEDSQVNVKLLNSAKTDKNDIAAEVFKSKIVLFGSPTINKGILTSISGLLEEIKGLGFKGKKAAAFGSYGWSGEAVGILSGLLKDAGFEICQEGIKALWNPTEEDRKACQQFGRMLVAS